MFSPSLMKEYYKDKEETDEVLVKDKDDIIWYRTGDLAHYNENGELFIDGRLRRIVMAADENGQPISETWNATISDAFTPISIIGSTTYYKGGLINLGTNIEENTEANPIWANSSNKNLKVNNDGDISGQSPSFISSSEEHTKYLIILPENVEYSDSFGMQDTITYINLPIRNFRNGSYKQFIIPQENYGTIDNPGWQGFDYTMYYKNTNQ